MAAVILSDTEDVNDVSGGDIVLAEPASLAVGELLLSGVSNTDTSRTTPALISGFTDIDSDAAGVMALRSMYRVADGTEGPNYTSTIGEPTAFSNGKMLRITGHNPASVIDGSASATTAGATSLNFPAVTTVTNDCLAVAFVNASEPFTALPVGWTLYDRYDSDYAAVYYRTQNPAGSTGTANQAFSISCSAVIHVVAIKSAPSLIEFIGIGVFAVGVTDAGNVNAAFPVGYTAVTGDVGLLLAQGKHNNGSSLAPSAPSGWTQIATQFQEAGAYDIQITAYRRVLQSGDSAPNIVCQTAYSTSSGGVSAYMMVFRNVDTLTVEDATAVASSGAAAATFVPTGITTVTNNAWVVSTCVTADDNALDLQSGSSQGFSIRAGAPGDASYDTTTGGDHAMGSATKPTTALGAVTCPTYVETLVGNDAWAAITIALRSLMVARPFISNRARLIKAGSW